MIRPVQKSDAPAVIELAVARGCSHEAEVAEVHSLMDDFLVRAQDQGHACLLDLDVDVDGESEFPMGVAHFYDKASHTAEARVRDYHQAGDDMVLYRKDLTTQDAQGDLGPAATAVEPAHAEGSRP